MATNPNSSYGTGNSYSQDSQLSYGASPYTAPLPAATTTQSPSTVLSAQIKAWALAEFKAAGYDDATANHMANVAGQQAILDYDAAISTGVSPLEAAERVRAQGGGRVIGELQKVGVTKLSNPGLLNPSAGGGSTVSAADMGNSLDQYRGGIAAGRKVYDAIASDPTNDPNARDTFQTVTAGRGDPATIGISGTIAARDVGAVGAINPAQASAVGAIAPERVSAVGAINPALMTPAQRLQAALAQSTTVDGTTLSTGQADEARALGMSNLRELQETAAGRGAAQQAADARTRADLASNAQVLQGAARAERGYDRKGALRAAMLLSAEQGANALVQREAQNAQERQQAQQAVGQQIQQTRTTDVQQASKAADLDAQKKTLQAQLDNARRINDANQINELTKKMADLDAQVAEFNATARNSASENAATRLQDANKTNAGATNLANESAASRLQDVIKTNTSATNSAQESAAARLQDVNKTNVANTLTADTTNVANMLEVDKANQGAINTSRERYEDRNVTAQVANNSGRLAANQAGSEQDIAYRRLQLDVQKAIEDSAKGLLDENQRAAALDIARKQLAMAQARADREAESYWFDKVSALLLGAGTIAAGLKTSDSRAKENFEKPTSEDYGALLDAVGESTRLYDYKPGVPGYQEGRQASYMADAIEKTKLGKTTIVKHKSGIRQVDQHKLTALLAAAIVDEKKRRASA